MNSRAQSLCQNSHGRISAEPLGSYQWPMTIPSPLNGGVWFANTTTFLDENVTFYLGLYCQASDPADSNAYYLVRSPDLTQAEYCFFPTACKATNFNEEGVVAQSPEYLYVFAPDAATLNSLIYAPPFQYTSMQVFALPFPTGGSNTPTPTASPTATPDNGTPTPTPNDATPTPTGTPNDGDPTPTATPPEGNPPKPPSDNTISAGGKNIQSGETTVTSNGSSVNSECSTVTSCGEPVNMSNGLLWHKVTDFALKGRTPDTSINFTRMYLAKSVVNKGDLGNYWHHAYETKILSVDYTETTNLIWIDEVGGAWTFTRNSDNSFTSPPGFFGELIEFEDRYELRKTRGVTFVFTRDKLIAPVGALVQIRERHGETVNLAYGSDRKLSSITTGLAGTVTITRDSQGRIGYITRARDNLTYQYQYDSAGNLISVTDFNGQTESYTYQNMGGAVGTLLTSIRDHLGRLLEFTYDAQGRAASQFEPDNGVRYFSYGNHTTQYTEIDGSMTTFYFDDHYRTVKTINSNGGIKEYSWNSLNQMVASIDEEENTTTYGYDSRGNLTSIKRPLDSRPVQITYDGQFDVPVLQKPLKDSQVSFAVNSQNGDISKITRANGSSNLSLQFTFDSFGNILTVNNGLTTYSNQFDANGLQTLAFDSDNPANRTYDSRGRVFERKFKSGRIVKYTYDDYDRVAQVEDNTSPVISFEYDEMGRVLSRSVGAGFSRIVDTFEWDAHDRLTRSIIHGVETNYVYDVGNRVLGQPVAILDKAGRGTQYEYDLLQRLIKKTDANGAVTRYSYDPRGNLITLIDPVGVTTSFEYDANGRLVQKIEATAVYANMRTQTQQSVTNYAYDAEGRVVSETHPFNSSSALKSVISYKYDDLGRLIEKKLAHTNSKTGAMVTEDLAVYQYSAQLDAVKLVSAVNSAEALSFVNQLAPPFRNTRFGVVGDVAHDVFAIARDSTGEIASIKNSRNEVIMQNSHDMLGRLTKTQAGSYAVNLSYDSFGRKMKVSFPDGITGSYGYDQYSRINEIVWKEKQKFKDRIQAQELITYDMLGSISEIERENSRHQYAYDPTYQLVRDTSMGKNWWNRNSSDRSFAYDLNGNRTLDSRYRDPAQVTSNFMTRQGVTDYQPDSKGFGARVTKHEGKFGRIDEYTYRADGRMTNYSRLVKTRRVLSVDYLYDALGRRIMKKHAKIGDQKHDCDRNERTLQSYIYLSDQDRIMQARNHEGKWVTYLDGQGIDEHLAYVVQHGSGKNQKYDGQAYLTDHLGSVINSPATGNDREYGPFGESVHHFEWNPWAFSFHQDPANYAYAGRQFDLESALYYNRARMYDPESGRFLSKDPIGFIAGDENLYRYVKNNPLISTDPMGLYGIIVPIPNYLPPVPIVVFPGSDLNQYGSSSSSRPSTLDQLSQIYSDLSNLQESQAALEARLKDQNLSKTKAQDIQKQLQQNIQQQQKSTDQFLDILNPVNWFNNNNNTTQGCII